MKQISFKDTFWRMLKLHVQLDGREPRKFLAPLGLAIMVLLLFGFAFADEPKELASKLFVIESIFALFLATEVSLMQTFEGEQKDLVFKILLSYPLDPVAWYLAKWVNAFLGALWIAGATGFFALLFHGYSAPMAALGLWVGALLLVLVGLTSVGTLLALLTLRVPSRSLLFPLLYFPLSVPVFLAGTQAGLLCMSGASWDALPWCGLLVGFDVIYLSLGAMLFSELLEM